MTVTVVNKYREPNHIYCGRGTPVGNPFVIGKDGDRDEVCEKYLAWFKEQLADPVNWSFDRFLYTLVEKAKIQDVNLGCFCAPRRCHCDTIKQYIDARLAE